MSYDLMGMMNRMGRAPTPIEPIAGVKYVAEFTKVDKTVVALTWFTHNKDAWKAILEAVRKLPERSYNAATKKWEVPWTGETKTWMEASGWKDPPKEKDPNEKREDPRIKQKAKIDATKLDPEGTLIPGLRPYQIDFLKFAQIRHGRLALGDEMGCVCGDMTVQVRKDGKDRKISLETLYREFSKSKETADWSILCYCPDYMYDMPYGEVVDVIQSGIKRCVHATLEDDTYLIATSDHKVLTDNGWTELKDTLNAYIEVEKNGRTSMERVVSITSAGMRMTYDVKVLNYGNFVANHVIVHNCGKTVEALSWMVYANAYPALYVVNAPTKLQWQGAYRKWVGATKKHYPDVDVLGGRKPYRLTRDKSYIINWDILADWKDELAKVGFRLLVGDEVQAIGNPESQRAAAFKELSEIIPHVIGMSGTPAMSKPLQFWTLLSIVEPSKFKNYYVYRNRYCDPQQDAYGTKYNGASNVEELHELLVNCMLRRTKSEVMKDLPPKVMEVVPLEVDAAGLDDYYEEERSTFSEDTVKGEKESARNKVAHLLRTAYALKEKSMLLWIEDFLESGKKLLLFAWHRSVVEVLYDTLKEYHPAIIYGGMTTNEREEARKKFIEDPKCRVIVANIQAGGVGIDGFQEVCSDVAFAEFSHTPNYHRQAEDRLHRSGQKTSVTSYYLVAPGTVDMDAIEVLDARAKMLDGVLDGKETATTDLLTELLERRGARFGR
jgi:superfamily II DNA or RNA helicase